MASKARNHFRALASSSSVPEPAASSFLDSPQHIDRVRIGCDACVQHVEEHCIRVHCALDDGEVVDGVPVEE